VNILQVGNEWFSAQGGGGSDRVFAALMHHLPCSGTAVRGIVPGPQSAGLNGAAPTTVTASTHASTDGLWTRWRSLRKQVRTSLLSDRPDVVGTHFALYAFPIIDLIRDRPLVVHFHGPWFQESALEGDARWKVFLKSRLERVVYNRANRFIVLSEAFRDVLMQSFGVSGERIRIVPGGVDVEAFQTGLSRREARKRLGWPTNRPILLSVRRLVHRVGLEPLIRAVEAVRQRVPDLLLLIAGKGPLRAGLEGLVAEYGMEDHVRLLGFVPDDDLATAYRAADVSIMPTQALEGFGLSAVESLAAGTPVLVTPVGGLPGIVAGLSEDLILRDRSEAALRDRLTDVFTSMLSLPSDAACRSHAAQHFDWPVIARQTLSIYQDLLS
jgi:glycosyltransferase involved in cell wall biosynthesis